MFSSLEPPLGMLWNALEDPRNTWKHFQDCNREEFRGRETFERSFRKEQRTVREWPVSVGAAAYSRLHKGEPPLLAVDVCSRVATKKARRNRASRKEEKKFGPAIVPVLKCPYALLCMNMTMMIPAAWVALFLLVALSYPAMA